MIDSKSNGESPPLSTLISWAACAAALGCLAYVSIGLPDEGAAFISIFRDFHLELPAATKIVLAIPHVAFFVVGGLLAVAVIAVQWRARPKNGATSFHLLVILLSLIAYIVYQRAMFGPMLNLIQGMSSQSGR